MDFHIAPHIIMGHLLGYCRDLAGPPTHPEVVQAFDLECQLCVNREIQSKLWLQGSMKENQPATHSHLKRSTITIR